MSNLMQELQNKYSVLDNLLTNFWKSLIKSNLTLKLQLRNIKWKNAKAKPGCAYQPTEIEQLANVITHGILIVPAVIGAIKLFERSRTSGQYLVSWVYGGALCMLFTISTFFHCSCYCVEKQPAIRSQQTHQQQAESTTLNASNHADIQQQQSSTTTTTAEKSWPIINWHTFSGLKNILHRCDRAMIYVFIAGSYFPWLTLENPNQSTILFCMEWIIWVMAAIGITYQQMYHERFKCLETFFYIVMGLGPALVVMFTGHDFPGMQELKLGGAFYILGIVFFKSDGTIPMAHAIWHLFVVLAAACHYYAILVNLYPSDGIVTAVNTNAATSTSSSSSSANANMFTNSS